MAKKSETPDRALDCIMCGRAFDPLASRWLCPYCKFKSSCCDGAPLAVKNAMKDDSD